MSGHALHHVGTAPPGSDVEQQVLTEIKALAAAAIGDLKVRWMELTGREAPRFAKRSLLTQLIA